MIPSPTSSPIPRPTLQASSSLHQQSFHTIDKLPRDASSLGPSHLTSHEQGHSLSISPPPHSPQSESLLPEEMERLCLIQQQIPPENSHVQSFLYEIKRNMTSNNIQNYIYKNLPYFIFEIIKDKIKTSSTPEVKKFCLRFLDFIQFNTNDFLSNQDCSFCWLDLEQPRLVEAHWIQTHRNVPITANLAQKQFLLHCFNMDLLENHFHKDRIIQNTFRPTSEEEYILFERTAPTLTKFSSLLQVYLTTDHQNKMHFLNELFQAPPPSHSDSILFQYDPFPSTHKPASNAESRESLISEADQMDLTHADDQSPPFLDQITDQPSAPHGISYPHPQDFNLTEEPIDRQINKTV